LGEPFVFSGFCCSPNHPAYNNGGLLHWATYGQRGGYAIRINPHKLHLLLNGERERFPDLVCRSGCVIYSDGAAEAELKKQYQVIASVAKEMIAALVKNELEQVDVFRSADPFWRVSSMLKDQYFKDEQEARLVALVLKQGRPGNPRHKIHVRHNDGLSIPFIKLFEGILLGERCPIEAIIIGPHTEKSRRERALRSYLHGMNLGFIEVIQSNVPYIG